MLVKKPIEPANPSNPSIKLNAFVITIIVKEVSNRLT